MKLITIISDVVVAKTPKFFKGQQVRVADHLADTLVERGHAKYENGKSRSEVKREKAVAEAKEGKEAKPDVTVTRKNGDE